MKQIKLMTLKQSGEKSVRDFAQLVNAQLRAMSNGRVVTAFMPNINRLYVIIEFEIDEADIKYK